MKRIVNLARQIVNHTETESEGKTIWPRDAEARGKAEAMGQRHGERRGAEKQREGKREPRR